MAVRIHPAVARVVASAVALVALLGMLSPLSGPDPMIVLCAASQRGPVEELAAEFQARSGRRVEVRFGASETILTSIVVTGQGDVFLPADESYIDAARQRGLVGESVSLARMRAVLVVPVGNPKNIRMWDDLMATRVRIAQAEPDAAAIGRLTRERLNASGLWTGLHERTFVYKATVTDVANAVALRTVDAGIVWDVVARANPRLATLELSELADIEARVAVAVVTTGRQALAARDFVHFLADPEYGRPVFRRHGFERFESSDR